MRQIKTICVLACVVISTAVFPACAVYGKCGFAGCADDVNIATQVRALMSHYPALEAPNSIRVESTNHVVYLYGQVDTELERSMAESVARAVPGVTRVVDSIGFSYAGP